MQLSAADLVKQEMVGVCNESPWDINMNATFYTGMAPTKDGDGHAGTRYSEIVSREAYPISKIHNTTCTYIYIYIYIYLYMSSPINQ